jgi:hypothetical protein
MMCKWGVDSIEGFWVVSMTQWVEAWGKKKWLGMSFFHV